MSIVMPCCNNESYVAEAIDSALGQSYDNIEVIVIDDGSSDASLDIIRSYGDRITWRSGPNEGACAARNKGLALARGEFIKFLDADDILLPECIAAQVEQSRGRSMSVVVFGDHVRVCEGSARVPDQPRPHGPGDEEFASLEWLFLTGPRTSSPLYARALLEKVGGFRIGLRRGQEHDLNLRLALAGVRFLHKPTTCYLQRSHGSPQRITNQIPPGGFVNRFDGPGPIKEFLLEAGSVTSDCEFRRLRKAVARYCWERGRIRLRCGDREMASVMFELATSVSARGCVSGGMTYRSLCRLFGPNLAEHVGDVLSTVSKLWTQRVPRPRAE